MTLPAVYELLDYWREHPPAHLLLAAALGFRGGSRKPDPAPLAELLAMAGAGGVLRG